MSRVAVFALAIVALAGVAAASVDSDWAGCMCWDQTTERMCDGSSTYCNRLVTREAWSFSGLAVAALAGVFFLFFPIAFACGRCCNCCGGRSPSYGCCCPYKRLGMQRFYSPSTVKAAKVWAVFVFLALGGSAWYLGHSISDAANTLDRISNVALSLITDAQTLTAEVNQAVNATTQFGVDPINVDLNGTIRTLHDISHSMTYASPHVRRGLYGQYVPAAVGLVVCILAFIGIRGIVITSSAMIMSFFACVFLFGLTVAGSGAMVGNFACDSSRNDTTRAFVNHSLEIDQLSRTVTAGTLQAQTAILDAVCNDLGLAQLCSSAVDDSFRCPSNPCSDNTTSVDARLFSVYNVLAQSNATWNVSVSIASCAQDVTCPLYGQANRLYQAYTATYPALLLLSPSTNTLIARAINGYVGVQVMDLLCGSDGARGSALKLTYAFLTMSIACILAMVFYIRGAKRFSSVGGPTDYIALAAPPAPLQQQQQPLQQPQWGTLMSAEATPMLYGVQIQHQPYVAPEANTNADNHYGAVKTGSDVA